MEQGGGSGIDAEERWGSGSNTQANRGEGQAIGGITKIHEISVLILQFAASFKNISESMKIADGLISGYSHKHQIDIVILPEMAFSGYMFESVEEIEGYLEQNNSGATFEWCKREAKRLGAYICCGYPERATVIKEQGEGGEESYERYNSLMVVSPDGNLFYNYRKHFLYETDEHWAKEGPCFKALSLPLRSGRSLKTGLAICMDINPYQFKADPNDNELGNFFKEEKVSLILFSSAWVAQSLTPQLLDQTVDYWINRLIPLTTFGGSDNKCVFVGCDRVGTEKGQAFAGSSCALRLNPQINIIDRLDHLVQRALLVNFDI